MTAVREDVKKLDAETRAAAIHEYWGRRGQGILERGWGDGQNAYYYMARHKANCALYRGEVRANIVLAKAGITRLYDWQIGYQDKKGHRTDGKREFPVEFVTELAKEPDPKEFRTLTYAKQQAKEAKEKQRQEEEQQEKERMMTFAKSWCRAHLEEAEAIIKDEKTKQAQRKIAMEATRLTERIRRDKEHRY